MLLLIHKLTAILDHQTLVALVDYLASHVVHLARELSVGLDGVDARSRRSESRYSNLVQSEAFCSLLCQTTATDRK